MQHLFDPGQHFFTQAHAATAALRHEGAQGADQAGIGVGGIDHQAHFGLPALFHMVRQILQLTGLLDQLPGAAQQHVAGFGQHRLASVDAQQRHPQLVLHACHGVAHRGLRTVQRFGRLGKTTVIDHRLQGPPLIQGNARRFHLRLLLS
ncbi:hypothetical protein D3C77_369990 [compost metagenome]